MNRSTTAQSREAKGILSGVSLLDVGVKFALLGLSVALIVMGAAALEGNVAYLSLFGSMFIAFSLLNIMGTSVDTVWASLVDE